MKNKILKTLLGILIFFSIPLVIILSGNKTASHGEKNIYTCPMHPSYVSEKPGSCPICGMDLVKKKPAVSEPGRDKALEEICVEHKCVMDNCAMCVKANIKPGEKISCPVCGEYMATGDGKAVPAGSTAVNISHEKQQLIGVKTEPVKQVELKKIVRAEGKIAYDPSLAVAQGEFIQALKSADSAKGSQLKDVLERANTLIDASRNKLKLLGMSEGQIALLEKNREADTSLYLPADGESVWAYAAIYEYEIGLVKNGNSVDIESLAYPGQDFKGAVVSISPVLDPVSRTNQVRIRVDNPENKLKPEMFVTANINISLGTKLAVPVSAVMDTGLRKIVYVSEGNGVLVSREVMLGQKAGDHYEVLGGLTEGDVVVTSGNFLVDSESKLTRAMSGQSHQHGR